jgi:hypothetical protein
LAFRFLEVGCLVMMRRMYTDAKRHIWCHGAGESPDTVYTMATTLDRA